MEIRPEKPEDRIAIHALNAQAFPSDAEARLIDSLRDASRLTISLVAIDNGKVVGHIAFSPLQGVADQGLGLAPLAVAESHRKQGVGARLVSEGLETARKLGTGFVVVLGEPSYYSRFGFGPARRWGLFDEYDGGFAFQAIELKPGSLPEGAGLIKYASEFGIFGP